MKELKCDNCSKLIQRYPSQINNNNFCSTDCHNEWNKGENNPSWSGGKIKSECSVCSKKFDYYPSQRSAKYCSTECKSTDERKEEYRKIRHFYNRTKWYNKRTEIKKRDGRQCRWCGTESNETLLQVHHLHPIHLGGKKYENSNLVTLCNRCHGHAHNAIKNS